MSLTTRGYYGRVVPTMALAGLLTLVFAVWGSMAGGWSSRDGDYQSNVLTIYGLVLECYIPAFIVMLINARIGVIAFWSLIAIGGALFCASGFHDGAMVMSAFSIVIPLLGQYVVGLKAELQQSRQRDVTPRSPTDRADAPPQAPRPSSPPQSAK